MGPGPFLFAGLPFAAVAGISQSLRDSTREDMEEGPNIFRQPGAVGATPGLRERLLRQGSDWRSNLSLIWLADHAQVAHCLVCSRVAFPCLCHITVTAPYSSICSPTSEIVDSFFDELAYTGSSSCFSALSPQHLYGRN